jgi:hypothetical protein
MTFAMGSPDVVGLVEIGALPAMPLNTWGAELPEEKATPVPC